MTKTPTRKVAAKQPLEQAKRARVIKAAPATNQASFKTTTRRKAKPAEVEAAITLPVIEPISAPSKQAQLIAKLRSPGGATLASLVELTGWQPHTVRGTISGVLRKRLNLQVVCSAEGDAGRVYRIVEAA